ncbi:hypothetical protein BMS3Abin06_01499 [bacterium BMS3Abin06]|nr:hypothetical protein BMS3Abin06_01499 [bacterium BMS3Abin06]
MADKSKKKSCGCGCDMLKQSSRKAAKDEKESKVISKK